MKKRRVRKSRQLSSDSEEELEFSASDGEGAKRHMDDARKQLQTKKRGPKSISSSHFYPPKAEDMR